MPAIAPFLSSHAISVAFFTALNSCIRLDSLCHPIAPRNVDLVAVWQKWMQHLQRQCGANVPATEFQNPAPSLMEQETLLWQNMRADRLWQSGQVDLGVGVNTLWEISAPLMFWTHPNAVIEPTDALDQLLLHSDIGQELPVGFLKAPQNANYICLGPQTRLALDAKLPQYEVSQSLSHQGVYVFDTLKDNHRVITLVPMYEVAANKVYGSAMLELHVQRPEEALNDLIQRVCKETGQGDYMVALAQAVAKLFLYMALPQAVCNEIKSYSQAKDQLNRSGPKKAAKFQRQLARLYDRMVVGPTEVGIGHSAVGAEGHGGGVGGGGDELSPHLRRGHFRMQPHGPNGSKRRLMFIAPTWVRADKLAA